jgi:poly(3-hydroxybutyrate) depolymerase
MLGSKLLIAAVLAAAAPAAFAVPASAAAHDNPLPHGACATQGSVGLAYLPGVNCRVARVDGYPRRFVVYVPRRRPASGRAPVVMMFHGSSGSGEQFLRISGWREQADATGLIAVFPTGVRYRVLDSGRRSTKWNAFGLDAQVRPELPPGYPSTSPWPADDVGFVDRIVGDLDARLPIDDHRVYASGFSNGAEFTARLAVERSTRLAAVAYSAGGLFSAQAPARPIPMFATVGSLDDRVLAQTGPPPLTELPRDPLGILTSPILDPFIAAHLGTLGLDDRAFGAIARRRSTVLRWPAQGSGPGGGVFQFGMLAGLDHHYPNGRRSAAGHDWVPRFWRFFEDHPLP